MTQVTPKLRSLSIFFPFLNDAGTVAEAITLAYEVGQSVTHDLEVIAIHGGNSSDDTWAQLHKMKRQFPDLKLIGKRDNKIGYAVIKHGFRAATKEWVFYTDGDLQYDVKELRKLVATQASTGVDVVNGYKVVRGDAWLRTYLAKVWSWFITRHKQFPIRDIDCDFRLIRRSMLGKTEFKASGAGILEELIERLVKNDARFAEVPVAHFPRKYGNSNYSVGQLIREKLRVISHE